MEDDWDDGTSNVNCANSGVMAGGTKFAAGRGFKSAETSNGSWSNGPSNSPSFDNNEWENADDSWGNNFETNGEHSGNGRGRGRGRGGRGGGRGRGRGGGRREGRDWDSESHNEGGRNGAGGRHGDNGEAPKPKDIYVPIERVADDELFTTTITSGVNFMKLDEIEVKVTGENVPSPIASFEQSGLRPHLLDNIKKSGYGKPTPIQKYAIPIILSGRDLMGCAQTGSGKTAAFLLPMINKIMASQNPPSRDTNNCQPNVIIVSPTRELAIQIYDQARKFAHNSIVKCAVAYGGTSVSHQRNLILGGCHILVATPGRLNDFVSKGHVSFNSVEFFVLDEADRMLDMGFLPTVEEMLSNASMTATGERQTLMFSATFPEEIQHLAGKFLHHYLFVAIGIVGSASTDVEQVFYSVTRFEKRAKLIEMLKNPNERTVVFVETKRNADFLATFLSENDIKSTSIHGDRLQKEREEALWDIKKGTRNILVATGVAARGLDIEGIQHVINYDLPKSIDEYVHRIGRTGRVGNRGKATSFYDEKSDRRLAGPLANILGQAGQEVPDFLSNASHEGGQEGDMFGGRDIRGDDYGQGQDYIQQPIENEDEAW